MVRETHILALVFVVVLGSFLSGCQSSGLKQSFSAELPIDGKITFSN